MMIKLSVFLAEHLTMGQTVTLHFEQLILKDGKRQMRNFVNIQSVNHILKAVAKWKGCLQSRKGGTVASQLDCHKKRAVEDNRAYLKAVIESILFCARQSTPLRGHDKGINSTNQGNLQELTILHSNDNELSRFIINQEKYFTYLHDSCQNEIITIMASQMQDSIMSGVKEAGVFSIITDKTMDL
nr:PREDICTED: zinc finger MYM-type protein 1-like [Latimeria chalumnae]|eukprot:XP_014344779.1 PREDICTED: zinc finger MYM-type protein 1-like [Latimeria chalumnae]